jgi:hypothetical protein
MNANVADRREENEAGMGGFMSHFVLSIFTQFFNHGIIYRCKSKDNPQICVFCGYTGNSFVINGLWPKRGGIKLQIHSLFCLRSFSLRQ